MENLKAISGHVCSRDCGQSTFAKEHQYRSSFTAFSVYLMPSHVTRSPTFVFAYCKIRANNKRKKSVSTTVQQQSRSKAMADLKGKRMASYTLVVPVEVTGNPEEREELHHLPQPPKRAYRETGRYSYIHPETELSLTRARGIRE